MTHTRVNKGVCSLSTTVTIEDGIIKSLAVDDGCDGNLKGIMALLPGMPAGEAVEKLGNITCGRKATSCPAQIALCIQEAMQKA